MILYEVLTLRAPWAGESFATALWAKVRAGERPAMTADEEAIAPEGYVALMRELWAQDPVARPMFVDTLQRLTALRKAADDEKRVKDERETENAAVLRDVQQVGHERAKSFVDRRRRRESKAGEVPPPSDWAVKQATAAKKYGTFTS